jgi:hypothetical protein
MSELQIGKGMKMRRIGLLMVLLVLAGTPVRGEIRSIDITIFGMD